MPTGANRVRSLLRVLAWSLVVALLASGAATRHRALAAVQPGEPPSVRQAGSQEPEAPDGTEPSEPTAAPAAPAASVASVVSAALFPDLTIGSVQNAALPDS